MRAVGRSSPAGRRAKLNVITATQDLAALAREVGGDNISVESIAKGYQDPHFVEPKPSFLLKLQKADLLVVVGLQLEIGWLPPLITQSGNPKIQVGAPGYLDMSQFCKILEIPTGQDHARRRRRAPAGQSALLARSGEWPAHCQGDCRQIFGDASRRRRLLRRSATPISTSVSPTAEKGWDAGMAPYRGRKVVTYHRSWPNFCRRFGLNVIDYVEPRPGIPPTPSHTLEVINTMKRDNCQSDPGGAVFRFARHRNSIAPGTRAAQVWCSTAFGWRRKRRSPNYFQLFDYDINLLTKAFLRPS